MLTVDKKHKRDYYGSPTSKKETVRFSVNCLYENLMFHQQPVVIVRNLPERTVLVVERTVFS